VLAQLSSVLNSVAGISFTPPSVAVGVGQTSRSVSGTTHLASASITGVTITLPKLTLPSGLLNLAVVSHAKTNATSHVAPRVSVPTTVSLGGTIEIATLGESASYGQGTLSSAGSPGSGKTLAGTGLSYSVPVAAALLVLTGLAVARRRRLAAEPS
jgi:hypothetical protein